MKIVYAILLITVSAIIFWYLFIAPAYKKINATQKLSIVTKNEIHTENKYYKKANSSYDMIAKIAKIANLMGINVETKISSNSISSQIIQIKATANYQQLIYLLTELTKKLKYLFILSISIFPINDQENITQLEMDVTFGINL